MRIMSTMLDMLYVLLRHMGENFVSYSDIETFSLIYVHFHVHVLLHENGHALVHGHPHGHGHMDMDI